MAGKRWGGFSADWSVWCAGSSPDSPVTQAADCPTWEHVEGRHSKTRAKDARARGWRQIPHVGWACPACFALRKEQGDAR